MTQPQPREPFTLYEHRWAWSEENYVYRQLVLNNDACRKLWSGEHSIAILQFDPTVRKLVCVRTTGASVTEADK